MVRVITPFRDRETWRAYAVGDEYDGTPERVQRLSEGGYVQSGLVAHEDGENGSDGLTDTAESISAEMTVTQLRQIADERGIEVPSRAKKAELLEILGA